MCWLRALSNPEGRCRWSAGGRVQTAWTGLQRGGLWVQSGAARALAACRVAEGDWLGAAAGLWESSVRGGCGFRRLHLAGSCSGAPAMAQVSAVMAARATGESVMRGLRGRILQILWAEGAEAREGARLTPGDQGCPIPRRLALCMLNLMSRWSGHGVDVSWWGRVCSSRTTGC